MSLSLSQHESTRGLLERMSAGIRPRFRAIAGTISRSLFGTLSAKGGAKQAVAATQRMCNPLCSQSMSVIGMFRQLSSRATANPTAFIDLAVFQT